MKATFKAWVARLAAPVEQPETDVWWAVWKSIEDDEVVTLREAHATPAEANAFLTEHGYTNAWLEMELASSI